MTVRRNKKGRTLFIGIDLSHCRAERFVWLQEKQESVNS